MIEEGMFNRLVGWLLLPTNRTLHLYAAYFDATFLDPAASSSEAQTVTRFWMGASTASRVFLAELSLRLYVILLEQHPRGPSTRCLVQ